jgi:hypothetical protein
MIIVLSQVHKAKPSVQIPTQMPMTNWMTDKRSRTRQSMNRKPNRLRAGDDFKDMVKINAEKLEEMFMWSWVENLWLMAQKKKKCTTLHGQSLRSIWKRLKAKKTSLQRDVEAEPLRAPQLSLPFLAPGKRAMERKEARKGNEGM